PPPARAPPAGLWPPGRLAPAPAGPPPARAPPAGPPRRVSAALRRSAWPPAGPRAAAARARLPPGVAGRAPRAPRRRGVPDGAARRRLGAEMDLGLGAPDAADRGRFGAGPKELELVPAPLSNLGSSATPVAVPPCSPRRPAPPLAAF